MAELQRSDITARVKQARKESGLTQEAMADLLDVAGRTYQNYESSRVPWGLIAKISEVTGRSTKWLLHGEEDAPPVASGDVMGVLTELSERLARIEEALGVDALDSTADPAEALERELEAAAQPSGSRTAGNAATGRARRPATR